MTSSKKFREKISENIRGHVILRFENRSFHQDRPQKFRLKYLNITSYRAQREKLLHPCKAVFYLWTSSVCVTLPPMLSKKFVFQHRPQEVMQKMLQCECIFRSWKSPIFSTSPPRGDAKKLVPCKRIFLSRKLPISSTSTPKRWCNMANS